LIHPAFALAVTLYIRNTVSTEIYTFLVHIHLLFIFVLMKLVDCLKYLLQGL